MNKLVENVTVNYQSSIRIAGSKVVYFDPWQLEGAPHDADVIFITHFHSDHFIPEDIAKARKADTLLVAPAMMEIAVRNAGFTGENALLVEPERSYDAAGIPVRTVPAYNLEKVFHPRINNWVGYLIELDGVSYYVTGDTDATPEAEATKCDVLLLPIGGKYTIDANEAAELANKIAPKVAVPVHYGCVIGRKGDVDVFAEALDSGIELEKLLKL